MMAKIKSDQTQGGLVYTTPPEVKHQRESYDKNLCVDKKGRSTKPVHVWSIVITDEGQVVRNARGEAVSVIRPCKYTVVEDSHLVFEDVEEYREYWKIQCKYIADQKAKSDAITKGSPVERRIAKQAIEQNMTLDEAIRRILKWDKEVI